MTLPRSDLPHGLLNPSKQRSMRDLLLGYQVSIISCIYWRINGPWSLPQRTRPNIYILLPVVGEMSIMVRSQVYAIPPGRFLILPEGVPHTLALKYGVTRHEQISIHCHIHDRLRRSLLSRFPSFLGELTSRPYFVQAFKELAWLMVHDPETGQLYGEILLKELVISQIRRGVGLDSQPAADLRLGTVIQHMEKDLGSVSLSVEDLAHAVNLSSVQLRKLFHRFAGVGPKQFLSDLRLQQATRLLRHTAAPVNRVAIDCGFATDHYFHRAFRKKFLCTPTEYRERNSIKI